jgi:predicted Ser/Thr protein kinase
MQKVKDTLRATVRMGYDGRVHKQFRGPKAEERFANEVRILKFLEQRQCPFVPRLLEADPENLLMVTTSCGSRVDHLDDERLKELFAELETFGVRHDDAEMRNVTYRMSDGRFCLIDFEFATILNDPTTPTS